MQLTIRHQTANSALMMAEEVCRAVMSGIDNPSDAILPWGVTLYRTAHAKRYNRQTGAYEDNGPEAAYESGWWTMSDDFLAATWFSQSASMSQAARNAFAIHPAWRSDCANFASVVPQCDLSVWYGLGKMIEDVDPATGDRLRMPASPDVLQIYIPGFRENHRKWVRHAATVPFGG